MDCPIQYSYSSAGVGGIWSFMKIGGGRTSGSEGRCLNHQNAIKQSAKLPIKLKYPQIKVPKMQRSNTKPPFWTSPRNKKRIQRFCDVLVVYRWGLHNFKKTVKHIFIVSSLAQQIQQLEPMTGPNSQPSPASILRTHLRNMSCGTNSILKPGVHQFPDVNVC